MCAMLKTRMRLLITFQLLSLLAGAQLPKTTHFISRNGLCVSSILLDSVGNFYREQGCEAKSRVSVGAYKIEGDKINFTFHRFDSLPPIFSITEDFSSSDSMIVVTFLTRQGNKLMSGVFSVDAIDTSGKFLQTLKLNGSGQLNINFRKFKELKLNYLENMYGTRVRVQLSNKNITVTLNQPALFFNYFRPRPEQGSNFSLQLRKDGLYAGEQKAFSLE
jgi:hypothetical protein